MGPLLRCPELRRVTGKGRTANYDDVKVGLLPPPVRIGSRAVAWPQPEVEKIVAARAAGATDDDIRRLVKRLVADRRERAVALGLTLESIKPGASIAQGVGSA